MNQNATKLVNQIISFIEEKEKIVKENLRNEEGYVKRQMEQDNFTPGWVKGIFFSWTYNQMNEDKGIKIKSDIAFHFEHNGISINDGHEKLVSDLDLTFLTDDLFDKEVEPALRTYLQKKVESEVYGGFYSEDIDMTITLSAFREMQENESADMQVNVWLQTTINVIDENRLEEQKQKIHDFIANEEYINSNISDYEEALMKIIWYSVKYYYEELGNNKLLSFYRWLIEASAKERYDSTMKEALHGLVKAGLELLESEDEESSKEPTDDEFSLACEVAMLILLNATDKYRRDWGGRILQTAKELRSSRAKEILRFGTGKLAKEDIQYKDSNVNCLANDIEKTIEFKIKNDNEEAYESMLKFIINLINKDFPSEYLIKCNYKKEEFAPKTKTEYFWDKCAAYPNLHSLMKEYVYANNNDYDYYSDATDEEAVPVGGYATFALGRASEDNKDIVEYFIENFDYEHAITAREYADEYIGQYGLHKDNISVIVTCLKKSEHYLPRNELVKSLEEIELLKEFVGYVENNLNKYEVYEIVERLWDSDDLLEEYIDKASQEHKPYYQKLLELVQENE